MINTLAILCLIAGLFGVFALIRYFCILRPDVYTNAFNVIPIIIGTLAWLSASVTFYQTHNYSSPINFERLGMVISWAMLIYRIKAYRDITKPTAK